MISNPNPPSSPSRNTLSINQDDHYRSSLSIPSPSPVSSPTTSSRHPRPSLSLPRDIPSPNESGVPRRGSLSLSTTRLGSSFDSATGRGLGPALGAATSPALLGTRGGLRSPLPSPKAGAVNPITFGTPSPSTEPRTTPSSGSKSLKRRFCSLTAPTTPSRAASSSPSSPSGPSAEKSSIADLDRAFAGLFDRNLWARRRDKGKENGSEGEEFGRTRGRKERRVSDSQCDLLSADFFKVKEKGIFDKKKKSSVERSPLSPKAYSAPPFSHSYDPDSDLEMSSRTQQRAPPRLVMVSPPTSRKPQFIVTQSNADAMNLDVSPPPTHYHTPESDSPQHPIAQPLPSPSIPRRPPLGMDLDEAPPMTAAVATFSQSGHYYPYNGSESTSSDGLGYSGGVASGSTSADDASVYIGSAAFGRLPASASAGKPFPRIEGPDDETAKYAFPTTSLPSLHPPTPSIAFPDSSEAESFSNADAEQGAAAIGGLAARRMRNKKHLSLVVPPTSLLGLGACLASPISPSGVKSAPGSPRYSTEENADLNREKEKEQVVKMKENLRGGLSMRRRTSIPALTIASSSSSSSTKSRVGHAGATRRTGGGGIETVQMLRGNEGSAYGYGDDGDDGKEEFPYAFGPRLILPGLYLGSEPNAKDPATLRRLGIAAVVNVAKEVECPWGEGKEVVNETKRHGREDSIEEADEDMEMGNAVATVSLPRSKSPAPSITSIATESTAYHSFTSGPSTSTLSSVPSTSSTSSGFPVVGSGTAVGFGPTPAISSTSSRPSNLKHRRIKTQAVNQLPSSASPSRLIRATSSTPNFQSSFQVGRSVQDVRVAAEETQTQVGAGSGSDVPSSPVNTAVPALSSSSPRIPRRPLASTPAASTSSTTHLPKVFPHNARTRRPTISYLKLPWSHDQENLVSAEFGPAFEFIDEYRTRGKNVLVHCQCGVSRSATLMIAYVMKEAAKAMEEAGKSSMPEDEIAVLEPIRGMHDAYSYVKDKSEYVGPNIGLVFQLVEFERHLSGKPLSSEGDMLPAEDTAAGGEAGKYVEEERPDWTGGDAASSSTNTSSELSRSSSDIAGSQARTTVTIPESHDVMNAPVSTDPMLSANTIKASDQTSNVYVLSLPRRTSQSLSPLPPHIAPPPPTPFHQVTPPHTATLPTIRPPNAARLHAKRFLFPPPARATTLTSTPTAAAFKVPELTGIASPAVIAASVATPSPSRPAFGAQQSRSERRDAHKRAFSTDLQSLIKGTFNRGA